MQDLVYLLSTLFALASVMESDVNLLRSQFAFGSDVLAYAGLFQPIFHVSTYQWMAEALGMLGGALPPHAHSLT